MVCLKCGARVARGSSTCGSCGEFIPGSVLQIPLDAPTYAASSLPANLADNHDTPTAFARSEDGETRLAMPPSPVPGATLTGAALTGAIGPLVPGSAFGSRYHLIRLLGMGGMGAVYQAWDEELGVSVALKVIRPEITADPAAARDIERRFKRELLLARQVTHKNVVRIHDLGEINGIKYLTMPYIQGRDLATILRAEVKLPVPRAVAIARQVASGLQAAHDAGVVHRDLKPANIMIDADDQAVIMDFGISRSVSGAGATVAGAVVGTLEYMAPEQAMAQPVDHRADIYAFGLMLRDMLVGPRNVGGAETAVAELMTRMHSALPPVRAVDATIPEGLEIVISRCTEPGVAGRYQATQELVADLDMLDRVNRRPTGTMPPIVLPGAPGHTGAAPALPPKPSVGFALKAGVAVALLASVLIAGWMLGGRSSRDDAAVVSDGGKPVSLAIVPLHNATGDAALDWLGPSLADMLAADIGQSAELHLVSSDRIFQLLRDLRISSATELDPGMLRRIAEFSSADTVAAGRFEKLGGQTRVNVTLHASGREPIVLRASAADENDLLRVAQELAGEIRKNLSLSAAALQNLQTRTFKPSSSSVQALRFFSEGTQSARNGEHLAAAKQLEEATRLDPQFALAYSKLALSLAALGRSADAESASRQAVALSGPLPAEERDLIVGTNARIINDIDAAIESFERLTRTRPGDVNLQFQLAELYERNGALDKARDAYAQIVSADPKHGEALYAAGRVAIRRGMFQEAVEPLNSALSLAIQLDNAEARARVLQALGVSYRSLGRHDDALVHYEQSLAIKKQIGDKRGIASSLAEIAYVHDLQGRPEDAVRSYKEAIEIRRELGDTRGLGVTLSNLGASYLDRGRYPEALEVLREALQIHRETGNEDSQARCLTNIGNVYFATSKYDEARTYLERALEIREKLKVAGETALLLASLADVSLRVGEYDRAQTHYLKAIELWRADGDRRGIAIGSYGMGTLLEIQARYGASADAKGEAMKTIRDLKEQSFWLVEILDGYGAVLAQLGRRDESKQILDEALTAARVLKNEMLVAQTFNALGNLAYYAGDMKTARAQFESARQAAERGTDPYHVLRSRVNLAKVTAEEGRPSAVAELRSLIREAESLGLKPLAAEGAVYLSVALIASKKGGDARRELESALARNERLGARALVARCQKLLADVARAGGDSPRAEVHLREARRVLDEIVKESRSQDIARRYDLAGILSLQSDRADRDVQTPFSIAEPGLEVSPGSGRGPTVESGTSG